MAIFGRWNIKIRGERGLCIMEKEPFFPPEVTGGAFKVTLTGRGRAWVEQHQGLLGYTAEEAPSARRRARCALAG